MDQIYKKLRCLYVLERGNEELEECKWLQEDKLKAKKKEAKKDSSPRWLIFYSSLPNKTIPALLSLHTSAGLSQ